MASTRKPFTPEEIEWTLCLARTWNAGRGGQCLRHRRDGSDFCAMHGAGDKWMVHGRVDGNVPEKKLREFEAATPARKRRRSETCEASAFLMETPEKEPQAGGSNSLDAGAVKADAPRRHHLALETAGLRVPDPQPGSLIGVVQALPDFAGALAELLWRQPRYEEEHLPSGVILRRRRGLPELSQLLFTGKSAQLALVVGVKERRATVHRQGQDLSMSRSYHEMCGILERACPRAWLLSRELRFCSTEEADVQAVLRLLEGTCSRDCGSQG
mmetsp:Transcript_123310/g.310386  ORF Transcript_123310/g.310386 Transcript_123310/m.310386 type:complete len:271 (-) Transcript_123310:67-879(-)